MNNNQVVVATAREFECKKLPRKYEAIEVFNRSITNPFRLLFFFYSTRNFKPDVIHIQGAIHPGMYFILWKILEKITDSICVYTAHDVFPKKKKIYHPYVLSQIYQFMSHIFLHAHQNKEQLLQHFKLPSERVSVIPFGNIMCLAKNLVSSEDLHIPKNKKVILFFGVIEPQKGLMTLIRAMPEIKKNIKNVLLLIAGQPFESVKPYIKEIEMLNIGDSVKLKLGYVPIDGIPPLFKAAHIVVLPYNKVYQSGVVSSAYSFGKPVVATSVGGLPECVCDGETGFLIPPCNSEALAKAAIRLLEDDHLREKMGKNALDAIERKYSWNSIAEKTEAIYHFLIEAN